MLAFFFSLYPEQHSHRKPVACADRDNNNGLYLKFNNSTDAKYLTICLLNLVNDVERYPFNFLMGEPNMFAECKPIPDITTAEVPHIRPGLTSCLANEIENFDPRDVWVVSSDQTHNQNNVIEQVKALYAAHMARRPIQCATPPSYRGVMLTFRTAEDAEYMRFTLLHPSKVGLIKAFHQGNLSKYARDSLKRFNL
jgi:hypothetical protein